MTDTRVVDLARKVALFVAVIGPLVATVYAIYLLWGRMVSPRDLWILAGMYTVCALGIAVGYHRMLAHRSFDAPAPVRFTFLALGSMALQGPAIAWGATHLKHHAKADRPGDPHSPLEGFWHAHLGWLFEGLERRGSPYARPFEKDPVVRFVDRTFFAWAALGFLIPYLAGGWTGLLWGGLVRTFLLHHVTWSVNSVCHAFGKRPYHTTDASRNEWLVGLLAFGEGWHNNHHAAPRAAFHGFHWWQLDVSGYLIRLLERVGLARNVVRADPRELQGGASARRGRGSRNPGASVGSSASGTNVRKDRYA